MTTFKRSFLLRLRDLRHVTSHFGAGLEVSHAILKRLGLQRLQRRFEQALARYSDSRARAFDARHGTDTFRRIHLGDLGLGGEDETFRQWMYGPINPDFFREIMRAGPPDRSRLTFLDVGSGKGLALMLASEYGFKKVVGVEMSDELNAVARQNFEAYSRSTGRACSPELLCADFLEVPLPMEPTYYFLNNPFPEHVGFDVVRHFENGFAQAPRDAWILWRRCTLSVLERLDQSPHLELVIATPYWYLFRTRAHLGP